MSSLNIQGLRVVERPPRTVPVWYPSAVLRELWDRLPVWFLFLSAINLLRFIRANVPERMFEASGVSRDGMSLTAVMPLSVVTAYYLLRAYRSKGLKSVPLTAAVILSFTVLLPVAIYFIYEFVPVHEVSESQIVSGFEHGQMLWFGVFFIHVWVKKGWDGLLQFWVVGLIYGVILENAGIVLGYFYEDNFRHYLHRLPAPICTMLGWVLVMYVCTAITEEFAALLPELRWTPLKLAFVTTCIAVAFDLQIDPMASLAGIWWEWNRALPPRWFGVPVINYVAWFSAVLPFSYWLQKTQHHHEWSPLQQAKQLFLRLHVIFIVAAVLNFGTMAIYESIGGHRLFHGPTFQILKTFINKILPYG